MPQAATPVDARILELAAKHIRRFGASRMTIVGLASELGMSHANVYRYFASKAVLIEALTLQWLKPIEAGLRGVADGPDPARDKLERFIGGLHLAYREKLETEPQAYDALLELFARRAPVAANHCVRIRTEAKRILEEGMTTSAFFSGDLGRAVTFVFDATHRFVHPVCVAEDRLTPRTELAARLDRVLDATLNGLTNRNR